MKQLTAFVFLLFTGIILNAQDIKNNPGSNHGNRFEQLGTILPTPNEYRTASGAPGPKYWQQRADYDITCELDEANRRLIGRETITYVNNSPDVLTYLWLQLDENEHSNTNNAGYQGSNTMPRAIGEADITRFGGKIDKDREYGVNITRVADATGKPLSYTINKTMMRIDLPQALKPGQQYIFKVDWNYNIIERTKYGGRGGYENFPEDGNDLYTMTQWFPRLCVYSDFQGWQNHQFVGSGEFALVFGNYKVAMTVPADHIVLSTGVGQNYQQVLTPAQFARWQKAQTATDVTEIVTLDEAVASEKQKSTQKKTWIFKADMVRDFAWGSSRKFVWDAMPTMVEGKKVMCMSGYGKEAYSLYRKYSTKAVAHTIKSYSKFTIPYPYPVAQSLEAANGMEYPMICFNFGRTEKDATGNYSANSTYSEGTKNGMLGVVIHEVGHNFFPMIINSDERQWTWMDEGLNSFVEYLTEELWDNKYPVGKGPAYKIVDYMKLPKDVLEPIMTNSENIIQFGPNAYSKPATGLNILRETIMGRESFDYAFKEYARRWAFKHPTPADLFRTMEDASADDLDWFWRGWFYGIEPCDISLDTVKWAVLNTDVTAPTNPGATTRKVPVAKPQLNTFDDISKIRNREDKKIVFATDADQSLRDFYWRYDRDLVKIDSTPFEITTPAGAPADTYSEAERFKIAGDKNMYELTFSNKGGLVMPIIIEWTFKDGSKEVDRIPVYVWRKNENKVVKTFLKNKEVVSIKLDPMRETADINTDNNTWPAITTPSKFQLFKGGGRGARGAAGGVNPMQKEIK
ncbi:MAG: M1 family metallopeptidase [Chitinophagaceae bacterium]|nr:M1 family metallopeptidase [Chitinophagaceae bacterium]